MYVVWMSCGIQSGGDKRDRAYAYGAAKLKLALTIRYLLLNFP